MDSNKRIGGAISKIAQMRCPFGKYEGIIVGDIPLSYLIEVVCDMRSSLFVEAVKKLISADATWILITDALEPCEHRLAEGETLRDLIDLQNI